MDQVPVNGITLEVTTAGRGEPVLCIHGTAIADACLPLLREPALTDRYHLIAYHRRGFAGSTRPPAAGTIADQAADAAALLHHAGVDRAHVVGYSYGGAVALQLALDAPSLVHSLALLEPGLRMVPSVRQFGEALAPIMAAHQAGDREAAIDGFLQLIGGPAYRQALDQTLPAGWFAQAVADSDATFQVDMPSIQAWTFTEDLAQRIARPVLAVCGADSLPRFVEGHALVRQWWPQAEQLVVPGATHLLPMTKPQAVADGLAGFFARHPLPVPA